MPRHKGKPLKAIVAVSRRVDHTDVASFGVDPCDPNVMVLPDVSSGHIFITGDGGANWTERDDLSALITDDGKFLMSTTLNRPRFELSNSQVSAIVFDPSNCDRILIGTAEAGIVFSPDRGETWTKISGSETIPNITSFAFTQASEALVSTWGRGIWTISLDVSGTARPSASLSAQPLKENEQSPLRRQPVRGDANSAQQMLKRVDYPVLMIGTVGRQLPPNVVLAGTALKITGARWALHGGAGTIRLMLDGRDVGVATLNSDGTFSSRLPAVLELGQHRLVARQRSEEKEGHESAVDFSAVT